MAFGEVVLVLLRSSRGEARASLELAVAPGTAREKAGFILRSLYSRLLSLNINNSQRMAM